MKNKYIFETNSLNEMELVINRQKMFSVLEDIKNWRRELYKGYDSNIKYLCNGKLYSFEEYIKNEESFPKNEQGFTKDLKMVYTTNELINKIDYFLSEVKHLL